MQQKEIKGEEKVVAYDMKIEILRHPEKEDWERCKMLALNTIGKRYAGAEVADEWKH